MGILDRGINCLSSSSGEQQQQQPCNVLNDDELQPAMDLFKALRKRNFGVHNHNGSLLNQQQQQQRQPEQQQQNRCRTQTILEEAMRVQEQSQFQSFRRTEGLELGLFLDAHGFFENRLCSAAVLLLLFRLSLLLLLLVQQAAVVVVHAEVSF